MQDNVFIKFALGVAIFIDLFNPTGVTGVLFLFGRSPKSSWLCDIFDVSELFEQVDLFNPASALFILGGSSKYSWLYEILDFSEFEQFENRNSFASIGMLEDDCISLMAPGFSGKIKVMEFFGTSS